MKLYYYVMIYVLGIICIINLTMTNKSLPHTLVLLPITFLIFMGFSKTINNQMFRSVGLTILNFTMTIRYIISPLFLSFYGNDYFIGSTPIMKYQYIAVNIMLYEMITVLLTQIIIGKKISLMRTHNKVNPSRNLFITIFTLVFGLILFLNPEVFSRYAFIWTSDTLKSKEVEGLEFSSVIMVIQLFHLLITILILNILYTLYKKNHNNLMILLSLICIVLSSSFISGTSRFSIILPLVTGLITILIIYEKHRKILGMLLGSFVFLIVVLSSILKKNTIENSNLESLTTTKGLNLDLQIYFSGLNNVAHSIATRNIFEPFDINTLFSDLFRGVIFVNSIFKSNESALVDYNLTFYAGGISRDQILPMIGQGYLTFDLLLAPILSILSVIIILMFENKIFKSTNVMDIYIHVYICVKFSLFMMGNFTNQLSLFANYFLVLLAISILNKAIVIRRRRE